MSTDEQFLQAMVYAMPDPVVCVDRSDCVVCWNKGAEALFLVDESSAVGRPLRQLIGADGAFVDGAQLRARRLDGVELHLRLGASAGVVEGQRIFVLANADAPRDPREGLSPRLRAVLERLLEGHAEKQIAFDLELSPHTVHDYVKALYKKFGVASRAELLALVLTATDKSR